MKLSDWMQKNKLNCRETAHKFGIININPSTNIFRYRNGERIPRKNETRSHCLRSGTKPTRSIPGRHLT